MTNDIWITRSIQLSAVIQDGLPMNDAKTGNEQTKVSENINYTILPSSLNDLTLQTTALCNKEVRLK